MDEIWIPLVWSPPIELVIAIDAPSKEELIAAYTSAVPDTDPN
jgi:hypothetical protein